MRLEHIGIAVSQIDDAISAYSKLLGGAPYKMERVESEQVDTHFLWAEGVKIELLSATSDDSVIARFIEKRGEGLHHLAFDVDNLEVAAARLESEGFKAIGAGPKQGADGKRIFFLHPKDLRGVLVECCARSGASPAERANTDLPNGRIRAFGSPESPALLLVTADSVPTVTPNPDHLISRLEPVFNVSHVHVIDNDAEYNELLHNVLLSTAHTNNGKLLTLGRCATEIGETILRSTNTSLTSWVHIDPDASSVPAPGSIDIPRLYVTAQVTGVTDGWQTAVLPRSAICPLDIARDALVPVCRAFMGV